jgi:hypothetical protein
MGNNVVQFPDKNAPDSDHVFVDDQGETWYRFTCSYVDYRRARMVFDIWALSQADAENRMEYLKSNAVVDGQVYQTVDA